MESDQQTSIVSRSQMDDDVVEIEGLLKNFHFEIRFLITDVHMIEFHISFEIHKLNETDFLHISINQICTKRKKCFLYSLQTY
jgi:hypothetical protein